MRRLLRFASRSLKLWSAYSLRHAPGSILYAMPMRADVANLPSDIGAFVKTLVALPGVVGVALGGSRGGSVEADAGSDWDFAVYYRGGIDLRALEAYGEVHPPGAWG